MIFPNSEAKPVAGLLSNGQDVCLFSLGCRSTSSGEPLPTDCNACLYLERVDTGECIETCPEGFREKDGTCVPSELCQLINVLAF